MDEQGPQEPQPLQISLIDLALARGDPRCLSLSYLAAFEKVRREIGNDGVDRTRVIQLMRVWQRWSAVVGGDVSWGVGEQIGMFMRIVPLDLEDAASICWVLHGPTGRPRHWRN